MDNETDDETGDNTGDETDGPGQADGFVQLRRSRKKDGSTQHMYADLDDETGALVPYEVDEGPIAAPMGGRYEKVTVVAADDLPALLVALGAPTGADPLAFVLATYKGKKSWTLVEAIETSGVPFEQDWW